MQIYVAKFVINLLAGIIFVPILLGIYFFLNLPLFYFYWDKRGILIKRYLWDCLMLVCLLSAGYLIMLSLSYIFEKNDFSVLNVSIETILTFGYLFGFGVILLLAIGVIAYISRGPSIDVNATGQKYRTIIQGVICLIMYHGINYSFSSVDSLNGYHNIEAQPVSDFIPSQNANFEGCVKFRNMIGSKTLVVCEGFPNEEAKRYLSRQGEVIGSINIDKAEKNNDLDEGLIEARCHRRDFANVNNMIIVSYKFQRADNINDGYIVSKSVNLIKGWLSLNCLSVGATILEPTGEILLVRVSLGGQQGVLLLNLWEKKFGLTHVIPEGPYYLIKATDEPLEEFGNSQLKS